MMLDTKVFGQIKKRNGQMTEFDSSRITKAVRAAMDSVGQEEAQEAAESVTEAVIKQLYTRNLIAPTIEQIQDVVEETLILQEYAKAAKAYILYRNERAQVRNQRRIIPDHVKDLVARSREYFTGPLSEFVYYRTYSRWIDDEGRRETWIETVDRYMDYMKHNLGDKLNADEYIEIRNGILNQEAMPSMRLAWSAGKACDADNVAAYNCAYVAIEEIQDFAEILYILMCGTGAGFSVEQHCIQKLPIVQHQHEDEEPEVWIIEDSKAGWANALKVGMETWYRGFDIEFDPSQLRPAGAKLKTMGGRSSGPDPLIELLGFVRGMILANQGRRLSSINCHDILCKIGEIVVVGGVRRSSEISLSDLDDIEMRDAKMGHFFINAPHRRLANNSVAYKEKPTPTQFMSEWLALAESGAGERGIFNRGSLSQQIPSRRLRTLEDDLLTVGTNPCGEIILKSHQFCNLSEVVARPEDTLKTLKNKIRLAAILGTYQSTLTNFPYLSNKWKHNCEQERLLGVSITGQWDSAEARKIDVQRWAKSIAVDTNKEYAERFGVNPSMAVTCVKPSGTVSQLVNSASGIHPRYAKYYIRRVRISGSDPLFQMLRDQKYPFNPEVGESLDTATTFVLDFPVKSPEGSVTKNDLTAIKQLEYWKQVKENFTEHNPSCTIYVGEDEWLEVGYWVYKYWDLIGGLSFMPREDHVYRLAPYEEITAERYATMVASLPEIDFSEIMSYEAEDQTSGSKEYACSGDKCDIM